jgi:hypothetical protein
MVVSVPNMASNVNKKLYRVNMKTSENLQELEDNKTLEMNQQPTSNQCNFHRFVILTTSEYQSIAVSPNWKVTHT